MILAGDIGGTKTKLGFFEETPEGLSCVKKRVYYSKVHPSIFAILDDFLDENPVEAACLGVAGPVEDGKVCATNLPWQLSEAEIARAVGTRTALLINDLVALSCGVLELSEADLVSLKPGTSDPRGARAVIAAGTGLGQGYLVPGLTAGFFRALPSEGGHSDFSPRNEIEVGILNLLRKKFGRVSTERVVSGMGIIYIYEYLRDVVGMEPDDVVEQAMIEADPNPVLAKRADHATSPIAAKTMDIFLSAYGAEAGDLALTLLATGGVYIGGGIARKILPLMEKGAFMRAFLDKGRFRGLMERIPVWVIVNEDAAILGAARCVRRTTYRPV